MRTLMRFAPYRLPKQARLDGCWTLRGLAVAALLALTSTALAQPAPLPEPRTGAAAVTMDGALYVVGGTDARGRLHETMLRYDPAFDQWTALPAPDEARTNAAAVVAKGKLYLLGGRRDNGQPTDKVEVYDPVEDEWDRIDNMRERRAGLAAVVLDGRIYAIGGLEDAEGRRHAVEYYDLSGEDDADDGSAGGDADDEDDSDETDDDETDDDEADDDDADDDDAYEGRWQVLDAWVFPVPLVSLVAVPAQGAIYAIGGFAPLAGPLAAATRYDAGGGVVAAGGLHVARGALAAAVVDGSIYVSGGLSRLDLPVATVDVLDTRTGTWSLAPSLAVARYDHASAAVGEEVYVIGGRGVGNRTLASVEVVERVDTATEDTEQPDRPALQIERLYPMPMHTSLTIAVGAQGVAPVDVRIYDVQGRLIWHRTEPMTAPGTQTLTWDGRGAEGHPVASGVYLLRVQQAGQHTARLLQVVR